MMPEWSETFPKTYELMTANRLASSWNEHHKPGEVVLLLKSPVEGKCFIRTTGAAYVLPADMEHGSVFIHLETIGMVALERVGISPLPSNPIPAVGFQRLLHSMRNISALASLLALSAAIGVGVGAFIGYAKGYNQGDLDRQHQPFQPAHSS